MHVKTCLLALFSGWFSLSAMAADCSTYRGTATPLSKEASVTLEKAFAAVHAHNARNLYALADRKVMLVRRMVTNPDERSGNIRFELRQRDLDASLGIRVGDQYMTELSQASAFVGLPTDNAVTVRRDICEDARKCEDALPGSEQLPFMLNDLLQCNQYAKGTYLYDDGMYVVDMIAAPGRMPTGGALYFSKSGKLGGIIIFN